MGANSGTRRFIVPLLGLPNNSVQESLEPPVAVVILLFARSFHVRHLNWKQIVIVDELDAWLTTGSISKRHEKTTTTAATSRPKTLVNSKCLPICRPRVSLFWFSVETWLSRWMCETISVGSSKRSTHARARHDVMLCLWESRDRLTAGRKDLIRILGEITEKNQQQQVMKYFLWLRTGDVMPRYLSSVKCAF